VTGIILPCAPGVKAVCPIRDPNPGELLPVVSARGHTHLMAIRYGIQADSEEECAEGLRFLLDAGLQQRMKPTMLTDGRWMARAVPAPATRTPEPAAPAEP